MCAHTLLLILDGAGIAPAERGNAVTADTMPCFFSAMEKHGHGILEASGPAVGLEDGQVGNSEVGHLTIGAGEIVPSTLGKIDKAFRSCAWRRHAMWQKIRAHGPRLHILGLLSDAGVHGHWKTLYQAAVCAAPHGFSDVVVHLVLDGVDSPRGSARSLYAGLASVLCDVPTARLGVVIGRRNFCDRSGDLSTSRQFANALCGRRSLGRFDVDLLDLTDGASEADFPGHVHVEDATIAPGEPILITSHRADRAVQAAEALTEIGPVYAMVPLGRAVPNERVFFPVTPRNRGLAFELHRGGVRTLRVAEACKFPHVTYFFNGFNGDLGEDTICIPSVREEEIRNKPEMSVVAITNAVRQAVLSDSHEVIIANIANLDQVGHTGDLDLTMRAARLVDRAFAELYAACQSQGWTLMATADHGNAERMLDDEGRGFGSHTENPVPLLVIAPPGTRQHWFAQYGTVAGVAPTVLESLGLDIPEWMQPALAKLQ